MKKVMALLLSMVLALSAFPTEAANVSETGRESKEAVNETIINDDQTMGDMFCFSFEGPWVHEGGYPDRFEGGDEHWITKAQFGDSMPAFEFSFVGTKVILYGHKTYDGAMAKVYVDGEEAGTIDYYSASRVERVVLFESAQLEEGEHVVRVVLTGEHNAAGGSNLEASVDYAVFYHSDMEFYPNQVVFDQESILLEEGLTYTPSYRILPSYATVSYPVTFVSLNEEIVSVDEETGKITALKEGSAEVEIRMEERDLSDKILVTVRESKEELSAMVTDNNYHSYEESYFDYLDSFYETGTDQLRSWSGCAWKNDEVTSRIDLFTKGNRYQNVKIEVSDFVGEDDQVIDRRQIHATYMESTLSHTNQQRITDVITDKTEKNLDAGKLQSIWVEIQVPKDAQAGNYTGVISLVSEETTLAEFSYALEVADLTLPDPEEYETQVELWMYPYSSNRYYSGKSTTEYFGDSIEDYYYVHLDETYDEGLYSQLDLYRKAGGDAITVTVVEDAWNSQTFDPYPSMVKWYRNADGSFRFDYTDLDKWVSMNLEKGINKQIKSFSLSCWGNRITYYDENSGKVVTVTPATGSDEWKMYWSAFLTDYAKHMEEKGWFDLTYISMDERPLNEITPVLDLVDSVKNSEGKSFKVSLAVYEYNAESIFDRIDDLSLAYALGSEKVSQLAKSREEKGLLTTIYTCGAQNSAMLNQPGESAYSLYHAYKYDTKGFLRWALDSFNDEPLESSQHRLFASGDLYLIYPDQKDSEEMKAQSSPRYEKLCEGIRNVEKLWYLEKNYPELQKKLDALQKSIGQSGMCSEVNRLNEKIHELSKEAVQGVEIPGIAIQEEDVSLKPGEKQQLTILWTPEDLKDTVLAETEKINDSEVEYLGTWIPENGYPDLFYQGDDHWCSITDAESMKEYGYRFEFFGERFSIVGNTENTAGKFDVYIDGEYAATVDPYSVEKIRFSTLYTSDLLEDGKHQVEVRGNGSKNENSTAYNMQLDYIEVQRSGKLLWTSSDENIASVDENGVVTAAAPGTAEITVKAGEYTAQTTVTVTENTEVPVEQTVFRISGSDRYATAYKTADTYKEVLGKEKFDVVIVATGKNFADALSGSYLAAVKQAPILLTSGKADNVAQLHSYIKANLTEGGMIYILGGTRAVPASVDTIKTAGYQVKRISGNTRYETSLKILAEAGITGNELIVATGKNFADSLSASAAERPIMLVKPEKGLSKEQKAVLEGLNDGKIFIVGGTGAVGEDIEKELEAYGEIVRLSGTSRYETSAAVAEAFFGGAKNAVLADGTKFPDGLCGGPLAAALNAPLILTKDENTAAAAEYVTANEITSGYVLGGEGALSDETVVTVFGLERAEQIMKK